MSCERLICPQCAGPVSEARCTVCREGRARVHHSHDTLTPALLMLGLVLVLMFTLLVAGRFAT